MSELSVTEVILEEAYLAMDLDIVVLQWEDGKLRRTKACDLLVGSDWYVYTDDYPVLETAMVLQKSDYEGWAKRVYKVRPTPQGEMPDVP